MNDFETCLAEPKVAQAFKSLKGKKFDIEKRITFNLKVRVTTRVLLEDAYFVTIWLHVSSRFVT